MSAGVVSAACSDQGGVGDGFRELLGGRSWGVLVTENKGAGLTLFVRQVHAAPLPRIRHRWRNEGGYHVLYRGRVWAVGPSPELVDDAALRGGGGPWGGFQRPVTQRRFAASHPPGRRGELAWVRWWCRAGRGTGFLDAFKVLGG